MKTFKISMLAILAIILVTFLVAGCSVESSQEKEPTVSQLIGSSKSDRDLSCNITTVNQLIKSLTACENYKTNECNTKISSDVWGGEYEIGCKKHTACVCDKDAVDVKLTESGTVQARNCFSKSWGGKGNTQCKWKDFCSSAKYVVDYLDCLMNGS